MDIDNETTTRAAIQIRLSQNKHFKAVFSSRGLFIYRPGFRFFLLRELPLR